MPDNRGFFERLWDGVTKTTCPNCDKYGGEEIERRVIGVTHRPGTVEQEEKHYDGQGKFTGTTKRPVQVMLKVTTYDQYYRCYLCMHEWSEGKEQIEQP
jgi:ribosomal protein L44E